MVTIGVTFTFLKSGMPTVWFSFFLLVKHLLGREPPQLLFLINLGHSTQNFIYW